MIHLFIICQKTILFKRVRTLVAPLWFYYFPCNAESSLTSCRTGWHYQYLQSRMLKRNHVMTILPEDQRIIVWSRWLFILNKVCFQLICLAYLFLLNFTQFGQYAFGLFAFFGLNIIIIYCILIKINEFTVNYTYKLSSNKLNWTKITNSKTSSLSSTLLVGNLIRI